jgi:hypothetical protein
MNGKFVDLLIMHLIANNEITDTPDRHHEIEPCLKFYNICPPEFQELLDPILSEWKISVYGDPDTVKETD